MADILENDITLEVDDGGQMNAHTAEPAGGTSHGLLLLQEAFGVNGHIRDLSRRFAGEGYRVIAPELYHRWAPGFEASYDDLASAKEIMARLTTETLEADLRAAYEWLHDEHGMASTAIGSVGFCLGGRVSLLANMALDLGASVSFYGGGMPKLAERANEVSAPAMFLWGRRDHAISAEDREIILSALDEAGKAYTSVLFSEAEHGFFCDPRKSYNPDAAAQAWPLTLAFFRQFLAG